MNKLFLPLENKLEKKALTIMRLGDIAGLIIFALIPICFFAYKFITTDDNVFLHRISYVVLFVLGFIFYIHIKTKIYYRNYSYQVYHDEIIIQKGVFVKKKIVIPYNIIQNVEISSGPIMRYYKFSNIQIATIGGVKTIDYINNDISTDLKNKIINNKNRYKLKF